MKQKRIAAALAALMMTAVMTACSSQESEMPADSSADTAATTELTSGTEGAASNDTEETGSETKAETEQTGSKSSTGASEQSGKSSTEPDESGYIRYETVPEAGKPAYDALIVFLEACKSGDSDKIISSSDLDVFLAMEGAADVKAVADGMLLKDYAVGACVDSMAIVEQYNEYRAEAIRDIGRMDDENKDKAQEYLKFLPEIDSAWCFDTEMQSDTKKQQMQLFVIHTKNGWKVDLSVLSAMNGYVGKSKIVSANAAAKSLYIAFTSALTDLDADGARISVLAGEYEFTGESFEDIKKPASGQSDAADKTALLNRLLYQVKEYYSEITKITLMKISISQNGDVDAVAVAKGEITDSMTGEKSIVFGTYPRQATKDDLKNIRTLNDALKYAKREG
ncbi:MAG: hypothetical protein J6Z45_03140 [Oscillospiraceae bacterium]|nr:hypothetical protein [Oscillospiraceae bacterium]